ncbi:phosphomannomutase-like [Octopus vulgaris]|uniref:Phosphomannomutase-like n=2 Tax=Octopus TaxID=6643 RepID=A0AA36BV97_OCTVU|nr:phosphomannomutase [Octopus sinensis]CAI9740427.1 phosphomannomutase-like [Octopus vulgaris]
MASRDMSTICLFDIDGTLTLPRQVISGEMKESLKALQQKVAVGLVGGSDKAKIVEQMGSNSDVIKEFDYFFSENGVIAYKNGDLIGEESIQKHFGEDKLQDVINFGLHYMSTIRLPCKRGTFIEFRKSMMNFCPIGRSCSQAERDAFSKYDQEHQVRKKFVDALYEKFPDLGLNYVIGGQISIDVIPEGWNKSYCLKFIKRDGFKTIHFFGDKTQPGGNDHEIYEDKRTIGHVVKNPADTIQQLQELFLG